MPGTYSGSLEEKIEKYDLRYDESMEQESEEFADAETEDYLETVQRIIAAEGM